MMNSNENEYDFETLETYEQYNNKKIKKEVCFHFNLIFCYFNNREHILCLDMLASKTK